MEKAELVSYFRGDLFFPDFKADSKEDALNQLAGKFVEANLVRNKALVLEMLHHRESIGSTGIGHGIAVPHGRTTAAPSLTIAFAKTADGIEWDAMDNNPVHFIFVVIAPPFEENNIYLPVLGRLVEFLSKESNREKLKDINEFEAFKNLLAA